MSLNLGALALNARATDIGVDSRPNETRSDELLSGSNTWMGESVQ